MTLYRLFQAGSVFLYVVRLAILLHFFLTLFNARNSFTDWLGGFISPFVTPFRRLSVWLISRTGIRLDFTYFFALIGLTFVERLWMFVYYILR